MAGFLSWIGDVGKNIKRGWESITPWDEDENRRKKQQEQSQKQTPTQPRNTGPTPQVRKQNVVDIPTVGKYTQQKNGSFLDQSGKNYSKNQVSQMQQIQRDFETRQDEINKGKPNVIKEIAKAPVTVGKFLGSGIQQSAAAVADTAIQGGTTLSALGTKANPFMSDEQKKKQLKADMGADAKLRGALHKQKDISGNKIIGNTDVDQNASNIASGRGKIGDYLAVGGKALDIGSTAVSPFNPARQLAKGLGGQTIKQAAKFAGRDAATFGTTDAIAAGAQTYGQTGDLGESLKQAGLAGAMSGGMQFGMDFGGHAVGQTIRKGANQAHESLIQTNPRYTELDAAVKNSSSLIERANMQREMKLIRKRERENGFIGGREDTVIDGTPEPIDSQYIRETVSKYSDPQKYINDQVELLWQRNKKGQGVDTTLVPSEHGGGFDRRVAISNNSPFYQAFYKEYGHKPTKREIAELFKKELDGEPTILSSLEEISPFERDIYGQIKEHGDGLNRITNEELGHDVSQSMPQDVSLEQRLPQDQLQNKLPEIQDQLQGGPQTDTLVPQNHGYSTPGRSAQSESPQMRDQNTPDNPYPNNMTDAEARQYVDQMNKRQIDSRKRTKEDVMGTIKEHGAGFREKFIDDLAPIEDRLNRSIKDGAAVDPKDHITHQLDRSRRSEGIVHAHVRDSGLDKIIQEVPDAKEFDQYLIAKHASELDSEIQTGRNKARDAALVKKLDGKYGDYAKKVYSYNQKLLDKSVDYGLISKETAAGLKQKYPDYVPLNRVFNEDELTKLSGTGGGEASLSSQSAVQKIKGSNRAIDSPLNSIIDKTRVVIEQGERNKAAKMLASYKDLPGNPFNLKKLPDSEPIGTRSAISYLENGKKVTYLTDKTIADAAKGMTREQIGFWGRVLSAPTRLLRAGATTVNAGFAGANVVKDVVGAAINSKKNIDIANPVVLGKSLAAALHHNGKYYTELMREGVAGTSFDMYRNMPDLNIKEIRSHKNVGARALHNARPDRWFRTAENTIGRSEDFGRALQYYANQRGFKRDGMSDSMAKLLAADEARNNSTNFFRHGSIGKNVNLAIPYWNAGVQGARITARRLKERPVSTVAKLGLTIAAPSAMIAMNNYADESRRKVIENIPEYEKEGNIIIVGKDAKFNEETNRWEGVYKWPVPPQWLGVHHAIQEAVKSTVTGEGYNIAEHAGNITENLTTINPTDLSKTANNYIPQLVKLITEPLTNTNTFTRDKVVPDSMKNLDKKDQVTKSSSGVARVIGKLTGQSPMMIDNSIRTASGGAGQNVVWAIDKMLEATGAIGKGEGRGRNLKESVTDRFVGARGTSDGQIYYKTLDQAAKDHKLSGKDLSIFNSLVDAKMNSKGEIEGKNERDALNKYQNLASHPNVAKAMSDAAKERSRQTGEPVDPLYQMGHSKQMKFYNIKAQNRDSQDQRDLEKREASWYKDFAKDRAKYFDTLDLKPSTNSNRVKYPEPSSKVQKLIDTYYNEKNTSKKYKMLDDHPEITKHFENLANYTNDVRKGQGVNPLRTYPRANKDVQKKMDAGNFKDPKVQAYMQDLNIYNLTLEASLAQIQGNEMSSKALKSAKNLGYSIVKNSDGTYSLKYADKQGGSKKSTSSGANSGGGSGGGSKSSSGKKKNKMTDKELFDLTAKLLGGSKIPTFEQYKKASSSARQMQKTNLKKYNTKKQGVKQLIKIR